MVQAVARLSAVHRMLLPTVRSDKSRGRLQGVAADSDSHISCSCHKVGGRGRCCFMLQLRPAPSRAASLRREAHYHLISPP